MTRLRQQGQSGAKNDTRMKVTVLMLASAVIFVLTVGMVWANESSVLPQGSSFEAIYTANIPPTLNGNNVTNIMIFEQGPGSQVSVHSPYTLTPGGVSVLTDTLNFSPTSAYILRLDLTTPLSGTGKRHLVMFVNEGFAASAGGHEFSYAFPPLHEQAFIDNLLAAESGDSSKLALLTGYFTNGPLTQAAFTIGESFAVVESSTFPTVPEPATMLLLGSGLIGLAGYGRKKFFRK